MRPDGVSSSASDLRDEELWLEVSFRTIYPSLRPVSAVRSLTIFPGFAEATLGMQFIDLHARVQNDIAARIRDQQELRTAAWR